MTPEEAELAELKRKLAAEVHARRVAELQLEYQTTLSEKQLALERAQALRDRLAASQAYKAGASRSDYGPLSAHADYRAALLTNDYPTTHHTDRDGYGSRAAQADRDAYSARDAYGSHQADRNDYGGHAAAPPPPHSYGTSTHANVRYAAPPPLRHHPYPQSTSQSGYAAAAAAAAAAATVAAVAPTGAPNTTNTTTAAAAAAATASHNRRAPPTHAQQPRVTAPPTRKGFRR